MTIRMREGRADQPVRDHVAGIPDNEHLAYFSHGEPRWQHPGVDACHEDGRGCWVVPDSLELLDHVPLPVRPILHDPVEDLADAERTLRRHLL